MVLFMAAAAVETKVAAQKEGELVGGYAEISVTSKEAKSFAAYAVRAWSKHEHKKFTVVKIVKAEQQVVAGENYRVCMDVREGRQKTHRVTAVVYENLKDKRKLSHWKTGGCTDL